MKKIDPKSVPVYCHDYKPYPDIYIHDKQEKYELNAMKYWDQFYQNNTTRFFKDRHWLTREFTELTEQHRETEVNILEVGCGVGNTTIPLLESMENIIIYSSDFSATAIELLKNRPGFNSQRCKAFVMDIAKEDFPDLVPKQGVDFILVIFVLSAISPEHYSGIAERFFKILKPGGYVLIRDYGRGDLAEHRFEKQPEKSKLDTNFYVRQDGTRAYYFTIEEMDKLFTSIGFICQQNQYIERTIENKKANVSMERIWIQCKFQKPILNNL